MNVRGAEVGKQGGWNRIGLLSLLSIMILVVSVGQTFAADDVKEFKLWHKPKDGEVAVVLKHKRSDDTDVTKEEAKLDDKMLRNSVDQGYLHFVRSYQAEPFQFLESIDKVLVAESNKKDGDVVKLLTSIQGGLEKVSENAYSAESPVKGIERRAAYQKLLKKLIEKLKALPKEEQKKLLADPEFLKKLFEGESSLLAELDLLDKKPEGSVTPTPTVTPSPSTTPVVDTEARRRLEEQERKNEELRNEIKALKEQKPVNQPTQRTGEVNDGNRDRTPVYSCNTPAPGGPGGSTGPSQQDIAKVIDQKISPFKDLINKLANDRATENPFKDIQQAKDKNKEDKQLADLLLPLLQDQNKQQQIQPPAAAPQLAQRAPVADNNNTNPALNQPIQPDQPQQQQPAAPLQFPSSPSTSLARDFKVDLPSHSFKREVIDASSMISEAKRITAQPEPSAMMPNGQQLPPMFALQMLEPEQQKTSLALTRANAELESVKEARGKLDDQIEQLKDGARSALPSWVKQEEQRLQSEADSAKKNFEQRKQFAQQAAQDPQLRDSIQAQVMQEQQEVTKKEQELAQFRQKIDSKVEEGNKDIAVLKSNADKLAKSEKDLSAQVDALQTRKTSLDNKVQQQYMTMMTPPQQQQQPQTSNVNKISAMGARPSTRTSQIGSAMPNARGNVVRGGLGTALSGVSAGSSNASSTSAQ